MTTTAERHRAAEEAIARRTTLAAGAVWGGLDLDDLDRSWRASADRMFVAVSAGQLAAASAADGYLDRLVAEQGDPRPPDARVQPRAYAGVASDGRPLDTLLAQPIVTTKTGILAGLPAPDAAIRGGYQLQALVGTMVADAGRHAVTAGMAARPQITGYRRQVQPGACSRCTILAGAWYRAPEPFLRHPMCLCSHAPAVGPKADLGGLEGFDPRANFDALTLEQQDQLYTKAGAQAIRDGADMGQVVNARRGMRTTTTYGRQVQTTTAGRSAASVRGPRLMPEAIMADARNREDALRLLRRFGYLA